MVVHATVKRYQKDVEGVNNTCTQHANLDESTSDEDREAWEALADEAQVTREKIHLATSAKEREKLFKKLDIYDVKPSSGMYKANNN